MDAILIEFLKYNWITLTACFSILKAIAVSCEWSETNSILETIQGVFFSVKNGSYKN